MKVDTSPIVKNRKISDIEKKYGTGKTMTKTMTFEILRFLIILLGVLTIGTLGGLIVFAAMDKEITNIVRIFEITISSLGSIIMAFMGYFIGRKVE